MQEVMGARSRDALLVRVFDTEEPVLEVERAAPALRTG